MDDFPNPYLNQAQLYRNPLALDLCQQIHFAACQSAVYHHLSLDVPGEVPVEQFKLQAARFGSEILLAHPAHIETIFQGITLNVYRTIETLFNTPLQRSVNTVITLLQKMARMVNHSPSNAEAIWAICAYLHPVREQDIAPRINRQPTTWAIFTLTPNVRVQQGRETAVPTLVCVMETEPPRFLAVRLCLAAADLAESVNLALYDALTGQRQPAQGAPFGVTWSAPTHLEYAFSLPANTLAALTQLGIEPRLAPVPPPTELAAGWDRDLSGQVLTPSQLVRTFDYYLWRIYGNSPRHAAAALDHSSYGLTGVNRNPGSLVPPLRLLLPQYPAQISTDGLVLFDGMRFESPQLAYFPGEAVMLQPSPEDASLAWVYLNENILCEARAREQQRGDGTYRRRRLEQIHDA